uniref:Uncharacterized protein n=1 Tax=Acrobeloides nanus TaxID=290746 RepID=A0A914C573_9BILA
MDEYAAYRMAFVLLMLTLFIGLYIGAKHLRSKYPRRTRQNHYDLLNSQHLDSELILHNISDSEDDFELFDRMNEATSGILVVERNDTK